MVSGKLDCTNKKTHTNTLKCTRATPRTFFYFSVITKSFHHLLFCIITNVSFFHYSDYRTPLENIQFSVRNCCILCDSHF